MSNKCEEILDFICANEIKIAALQETKLTARSKDPSFEGYSVVRKHRGSNGGGLLFLIHQSIPFTAVVVEPSPAAPMEHQSVRISFGKDSLTVHNIYIPPSSSCPSSFNPTLAQFLKSSCSLTLGDFNAHDTLWCSPIHDQRGESLADEISMSSSGVLNTDTQTRLPSSGQPTSPDVSIASEDLLTSANWKTSTTLSSDHLPITISLNLAPDFNAHDTLWCSPIHDQRGESLADEISMSSSGVLNTDTQTRLPSSGQPTSPDVSIASEDLLTSANWKTSTTLSKLQEGPGHWAPGGFW